MKFLLILWWAAYIVCALVLQQQLPGFDALAPGFLLALQKNKKAELCWLFLLFVLIQEGTGALRFGTAMLWYGGQIFFFRLSARLFVADNLLFVTMLAASLGGFRVALLWLMCALQNAPLNYAQLLQESVIQAALIPPLWGIAYLLHPKRFRHAH